MPLTYLPAEAAFTSAPDTYFGYPSSYCHDRDLDTFCHVYWTSDPSFTYDFETPRQIESVAVHNRRDHSSYTNPTAGSNVCCMASRTRCEQRGVASRTTRRASSQSSMPLLSASCTAATGATAIVRRRVCE